MDTGGGRSHGTLQHYLDDIRAWEVANHKVGSVTGNFLSLLKFWLEYYLYRGKDCLALELSSSIHFSEWRKIVHLLVKLLQPPAADGGETTEAQRQLDLLCLASTPPLPRQGSL